MKMFCLHVDFVNCLFKSGHACIRGERISDRLLEPMLKDLSVLQNPYDLRPKGHLRNMAPPLERKQLGLGRQRSLATFPSQKS